MAIRYGGKYSPPNPAPDQSADRAAKARPATAHAPDSTRRGKAGGRVTALFIVPMVFVLTAFWQSPVGLALDLGAFAVLILAAWLTRAGIAAQAAYEARRTARRTALPRKIFGSALTGAGLFLGALHDGGGLLNPAILGGLGALLHLAAFGPDPLRDKGMAGIDGFQTDRVARAVGEAEKHLAAMKEAIGRAGDRRLAARVDAFAETARVMFRTIEADPRDLTAARKYLGVYLSGARDATVSFADLYARGHDARTRSDYEALLDDLEANFSTRTAALLANDKTDLDIQIDVLRERLQREGIHAD